MACAINLQQTFSAIKNYNYSSVSVSEIILCNIIISSVYYDMIHFYSTA